MKEKTYKVVVAMSGGVDSSVAAYLLKKAGFNVYGVFMHFWHPPYLYQSKCENSCCTSESLYRAKLVARKLDIPFYAWNFKAPFKKLIVDDFIKKLDGGLTPNPCILCNHYIKFDLLLRKIKTIFKADYLATGHYVRLKKTKKGFEILKALDTKKDQSYFLYNIRQNRLKNLLFPIGNFTKKEIMQLAKKIKLPLAEKESQDICFVGGKLEYFLDKYLKAIDGQIRDIDTNNILGRHKGLAFYTIGQRSRLGLSGGPYYVVAKDKIKNILWVSNNPGHPKLNQKEVFINKVNWILGKPELPLKSLVKIRSQDKGCESKIFAHKRGVKVIFNRLQRAVTPGQSAVFYQGGKVLGGGVIVDNYS